MQNSDVDLLYELESKLNEEMATSKYWHDEYKNQEEEIEELNSLLDIACQKIADLTNVSKMDVLRKLVEEREL